VDVIAERELILTTTEGKEEKVLVRFGRPTSVPGGWRTPFEIAGPGEEQIRHFEGGADSVQSLIHALFAVRLHLETMGRRGHFVCMEAPGHWFPEVALTAEAPPPSSAPPPVNPP
jgi:hypothetical protein